MDRFTINLLASERHDAFFAYLNDLLSENGNTEAGYFQPLSKVVSMLPAEKIDAFRVGSERSIKTPGWRRAWTACTPEGDIIGHVDLRGYPDQHMEHRCLLGMGVKAAYRRKGIGKNLIALVKEWGANEANVEWIDLQVLSQNAAAVSLYRASGFETIGEMRDQFRIDGHSFAYTTMTLALARKPSRES